ncbi:MAG: NADH-quinone oxidoreductase subunit J [Armatimonadetes bacterium]|nr:NADH-quinone oxidoreductase subunit J [Armatimonadota bacterium]
MNLPVTGEQLTFMALAGIAALMAVGVVVLNNPVRSAMCLVVNFFFLAFIYFTLNAQLLGISQILVYTGAIMVLFLFVVMLLNLGGKQIFKERRDFKPILGMVVGVSLFGMISSQLILPMLKVDQIRADNAYGAPQSIGKTLFTNYVWPFEIASVLLLVGIVGSILLAKRRV